MSRTVTGKLADVAELDPSDEMLRARLALDAGRMGSWIWDVEEDIIHGDRFTAELFDLGTDRETWPRSAVFKNIHPEDVPHIQAVMGEVLAHQDIYEVEFRKFVEDDGSGDDDVIWIRNRARVTDRGTNGRAMRIMGVCWDITTEKLHREAITSIAADMDHRAKNAFAVIRSMINIGNRKSHSIDSFAETLRGQVEAIASAHALAASVSRATEIPQAPVSIRQLIENALRPWTVLLDANDDRVSVTGRDELKIASERATSIAMLIHELAASSERHGALGPAGGNLQVDLQESDATQVVIAWQEDFKASLGHADAAPMDGFGSTLMSHCVATLHGEITRNLNAGGLQILLRIEI